MSMAGVICLPSRTPSPSQFGEVLGEWGAEVWLDELPLFCSDLVVMDDRLGGSSPLDLGEEVVTGDLDENLHVYTSPPDWLAADDDQAPASKRQRLDVPFDETGLPPENAAPPPPPSDETGPFRGSDLAPANVAPAPAPDLGAPPPAALSGYVDAAWAARLVENLGGLTRANEDEWRQYLVEAFGATSGSSAPRKDAVRKAVLMDKMLLALSQQTCKVQPCDCIRASRLPESE